MATCENVDSVLNPLLIIFFLHMYTVHLLIHSLNYMYMYIACGSMCSLSSFTSPGSGSVNSIFVGN